MEKENRRPVQTIRLGRIKAPIWVNHGEKGPWYSVKVYRIYKNGDQWKQSDSFGRDDLPLVRKVLDQAYTWIYEQGKSAKNGEGAENPVE